MKRILKQQAFRLTSLCVGICFLAQAAAAQTAQPGACDQPPCSAAINATAGQSASPKITNETLTSEDAPPDFYQPVRAQTGFLNTNYAVSLNGSAPINVREGRSIHLLYALSTTQGYDSAIVGPFQNISSYTSVYDIYGGVLWSFPGSYILLQEDSAFPYLGSSQIRGREYHQTSLQTGVGLDENLNWLFEAKSDIGNNTITELLPASQTIVNGIAVPSPGAATVGINLGFIWATDLVSVLDWTPGRNLFSFRAENTNQQFYGIDFHDNRASFEGSYERAITDKTDFGAYVLGRHETGGIFCDTVGAGLIGSTRPTNRLYLEASGGPEYDSSGCIRHQGIDFHFRGTYQTSRSSYIYALTDRVYSSGFSPIGYWLDNAEAGFSKRVTRRLTWNLGGGYQTGFVVPGITSYHSYYGLTDLRMQMTNSLSLEGSYEFLDQLVIGQTPHRSIVLFTLRWSPPNHDPQRTSTYYRHRTPPDNPVETDHD